ncbi:hypothetical protein [Bacillus sp. AK031]
MKKLHLVLSLLFVSTALFSCQQGNEIPADTENPNSSSLEKVTIYFMDNQLEKRIIKDTETIEMINDAIHNAEKQSGIVDMADPEYKISLGNDTYFLWMSENSGTIMNSEDTHSIYTLSENSINQVNELLK